MSRKESIKKKREKLRSRKKRKKKVDLYMNDRRKIFFFFFFFFFKQKTAYEIMPNLVGSEMCVRDRYYKDSFKFISIEHLSKTILGKKNKKIVLKKQKQKKGTSKNQLNPVGAAVSEARPAEAGISILPAAGEKPWVFFLRQKGASYTHFLKM